MSHHSEAVSTESGKRLLATDRYLGSYLEANGRKALLDAIRGIEADVSRMQTGISYNEDQRRQLLTFVQVVADLEITTWDVGVEDTVVVNRADADTLLSVFEEAQSLARRFTGGLPF